MATQRSSARRWTATSRLVAALGGGLLVVACAGQDAQEPDAADDSWEVVEEFDSQAGDDLGAVDGALVSVEPACVEPDGQVTVTAAGLAPDTEHLVAIEPDPAGDGFDPSVTVPSDADGELQVVANLAGASDPEVGTYEVALYEGDQAPAGAWLLAADLEIAEECPVS